MNVPNGKEGAGHSPVSPPLPTPLRRRPRNQLSGAERKCGADYSGRRPSAQVRNVPTTAARLCRKGRGGLGLNSQPGSSASG